MASKHTPRPGQSPEEKAKVAHTSAIASAQQSPHRWVALGGIGLAVALVIMDATIANVALPVVIRELNLTATETQWMNAVYALTFGALILLSGRLADIFGRKRLLWIGLAVFMTASLAVGLSQSAAFIVTARMIQGIGGALIMPATLSTINALFKGRDRAIAFAFYGSMIGGMAAVGPLLGGWLATDHSWRWAFWINIPFGLVSLILTLRFSPETRDPDARRAIDFPGTLLATAGMGAIVFGLIQATDFGWFRSHDGALSPVPFAILGGVLAMTVFVWVEIARERRGKNVLAHMDMFKIPSFRWGSLAALIVALGEFGMLFVIPLLLQGALGYDPIHTGWILMALAAGTFVSSGLVPVMTKLFGSRMVVRIGLILEALAIAVLAWILPANSWAISAALAAYGFGVGFATAQLTSIILEDVPVERSGEASGMQTTARQVGTSLGIALLGGLLISGLSSGTRDGLIDAGVPAGPAEGIVTAVRESVGQAIPGLLANPETQAAGEIAADAMVSAAKETVGIAAGVLGVGFIATLLLGRGPKRNEHEGHSASAAPTS